MLAENVDEGLRPLRQGARGRPPGRGEGGGRRIPPGKPLVECVEVVDDRYAEAVERLLGGIYVIEGPEERPVQRLRAVTRQGLRLTRTSLSLRPGGSSPRCTRLAAERERLDALKAGTRRDALRPAEEDLHASQRMERLPPPRAEPLSPCRSPVRQTLLAHGALRRLTAVEDLS